MKETMTPKERCLAALRMESVDRLPFWPKLDQAYPKWQVAPFQEMDIDSIHDWIGSDRFTGIGGCTREERNRTSVETVQSEDTRRILYRARHGELELVEKFDTPSHSWHPTKYPVQNLEDIRIMTEVYEDVTVELDRDELENATVRAREIGQTALTVTCIGTSPLMHWIEYLAGVEMGHCLLRDHQCEVEDLFDVMQKVVLRTTEIVCSYHPADVLVSSENTSTTLISPNQFKRYCALHLSEYAQVTNRAGRSLMLHMCGHLKALLPDLAQIPAQSFEAFTSPTLGNTTLLDGRTHCPNTCLVGGTNAVLWTKPADEIIARIENDLNLLPHHRGIVVTSAGVMPPLCEPETIKQVCDWVKRYPAKMIGG
jgi:uroporphyrinogen decarboxylase-like protein